MSEPRPDFPQWLRAQMIRAGHVNNRGDASPDSLAAATGGKVSSSLIYRWLNAGVGAPSRANLRRIAEPLKVPYVQLLVAAGYMDSADVGQKWADPSDYDIDPVDAIRASDKLTEQQKQVLIGVYKSMLPAQTPKPKQRRRRASNG